MAVLQKSARHRKIETLLRILFVLLVAAHVVALTTHFFLAYTKVFQVQRIPEDQRRFHIAEGAHLNSVLEELRRRKLAPAPFYVRLALMRHDPDLVIKKGNYRFPEEASTWDLIQQFGDGHVLLEKITIPEGLDHWEVARLLGESRWGTEAQFQALIDDPTPIRALDGDATNLEGYLFPETYFFPEEATPEQIVGTMVRHFVTRTESLRARLPAAGMTVREWVALASLVEKESAIPQERNRIAGVFSNRLKRGMLLQCDPTIIYSLKLNNQYRGKIYRSQIRHDHPYNTYVYKGLPPGPIASPGIQSLTAALEPESHGFYYFVARNDGTHQFSKNLREHNRAVRRYRRP